LLGSGGSPTLKYITSVIIYGTIGYFLQFVNATSEFVVLCRGVLGSLFILFVLLTNKSKFDFNAIKRNIITLVISGISLGLNWLFLFNGYRYAVSLASLCNYTAPIVVVVITTLIFKEKLSKIKLACIVASFIGIVFVSGIVGGKEAIDIHAIIFGLLAAACFVVLVLCNKNLKDIKPLEKTFVQLLVSALTVLPYVIVNKSYPTSLDGQSLLFLLLLGFFHTGVAYILYFGSIDSLEPSKIAIFGYIEPVLSVLSGVLLLGEKANVYTIVGGVLIIGSALICELASTKK